MKHDIYLRSHTRILNPQAEQNPRLNKSTPDVQYVLLLDTETTTDAKQNLNFGVYQFCEAGPDGDFACLEEGLFHADDLNAAQLEVLHVCPE